MTRSRILKETAPILRNRLVVCAIGTPDQELYAIDVQPRKVSKPDTMGYAASTGSGLALSQPKQVIAISRKCESRNKTSPVIPVDPVAISDRFMTAFRA
jgi:hypothetical protein